MPKITSLSFVTHKSVSNELTPSRKARSKDGIVFSGSLTGEPL